VQIPCLGRELAYVFVFTTELLQHGEQAYRFQGHREADALEGQRQIQLRQALTLSGGKIAQKMLPPSSKPNRHLTKLSFTRNVVILPSNPGANLAGGGGGKWWRESMWPLSKDERTWLCPTARKHRLLAPDNSGRRPAATSSDAWQANDAQGGDEGNCAPNDWMCNPPADRSDIWGHGPKEYYWRTHLSANSLHTGSCSGYWRVLEDQKKLKE